MAIDHTERLWCSQMGSLWRGTQLLETSRTSLIDLWVGMMLLRSDTTAYLIYNLVHGDQRRPWPVSQWQWRPWDNERSMWPSGNLEILWGLCDQCGGYEPLRYIRYLRSCEWPMVRLGANVLHESNRHWYITIANNLPSLYNWFVILIMFINLSSSWFLLIHRNLAKHEACILFWTPYVGIETLACLQSVSILFVHAAVSLLKNYLYCDLR